MKTNSGRPRVEIVALLAGILMISSSTASAQSGKRVWNFDQDAAGKPPAGFTSALTGQGAIGQWVVKEDASAPSPPQVLAQTTQDTTDYRFPLAIAEDTSYKDLSLSVKFKIISGKVDQGAGLVFRLKDKDNYYIVRANALEDNYRIYHVVKGRRVQFAGANFKVTPNAWHEIKLEARGNEFKCYYDGQLKITAKDDTFNDGGKIGLWTKADSVIYFDDFIAEELSGAKATASRDTILAQKLVDELVARHPGLVRVGLHLTPPSSQDNIIVACNVKGRIGRKSDPEDLQAIKSQTPVVLKEEGNFDVTLPLHDAAGKVVGAIGLTFKPERNESDSDATERARRLAREIEKQITSPTKLFESAS